MEIKIKEGMKCKQVKNMEDYGFDYVGKEFEITKVTDKIITIKCNMGFGGITHEEFNDYFEIIEEPKNEKWTSLEGVKVIRNGVATIVILPDGSKGISKCLPEDNYNAEKGFDIAYTKAEIKSLTKKLKQLSK